MNEKTKELIAYLEGCAGKGEGADLRADLATHLSTALRAMLQNRPAQSAPAKGPQAFRIDLWGLDGLHEPRLGESDDEGVARAIYASAAKQFPGRKITLAHGAEILEDSRQWAAPQKSAAP
jgi:hypothetical protein